GVCTPMTLEIGTDKLNATYKATATLAAGCHTYYVVGVDASSARVSYPTTGVYNIPVGSSTCDDYVASNSGSDCDPGTATTGVAGANGQGGSSGTTGSGGSAGATGSGGAAGSGGKGGATGSGGAGKGGATGSGGTVATGSGGTTG